MLEMQKKYSLNQVKESFDKVISFTQNIDEPQTDVLFNKWYENKKKFIDIFGGLTYELPEMVYFCSSQRARDEKFGDFLWKCLKQFDLDIDTINFIKAQREGFYDNKVVTAYPRIQEGTKLSKSLKFFIKDKEPLIEVQNYMSRLIQEEVVSGTLVLSVHPLDYLSISENNHNWTSCHSLEGERRSGNLNYMADKCTILCYLKSQDQQNINGFPQDLEWNSKKWRTLLYINEDNTLFFAGKQYPFESEGAMPFVKEHLINKLFNNNLSNWQVVHKDFDDQDYDAVSIDNKRYDIYQLISDNNNTNQFNDCLSSSCYEPIFMRDLSKSDYKTMLIGEPVPCLECGKRSIEFGERMKCINCNDGTYCKICGDYTSEEDIITVDNVSLCRYCFEDNTRTCGNCGDDHLTDNMHYINDEDIFVCEDCFQAHEERDERESEYLRMV